MNGEDAVSRKPETQRGSDSGPLTASYLNVVENPTVSPGVGDSGRIVLEASFH